MVHVTSADLTGKLDNFGQLELVRAEWWDEAPRFVLLRYSLNGREQPSGVRLDLDKKAILDSVHNALLDDALRKRRVQIWNLVIAEQEAVAHAH